MAQGKNFSAGIDYTRFVKMTKDEAGHVAEVGYNLLKHIENLPIPVIAAVKGETSGAGLGLALAADIRIASSDAIFSLPEAQFGVPSIFGSPRDCTRPWSRQAKELHRRTVDAEEALRIGLVNKVVPIDALDDEANRLAVTIGGNSLSSLRSIKMLLNVGLNEGYEVGLRQEVTAFSEAFDPDTKQWDDVKIDNRCREHLIRHFHEETAARKYEGGNKRISAAFMGEDQRG
jgi:enoyl-CoA hydratase